MFCVQARDGDEREKWVRFLEDTIAASTRHRTYCDPTQTLQSMGGSAASTKNNYLTLFDKKVIEADTYLQMIIDQTSKIEQRIDALEDAEEKAKYDSIKRQTDEMLDHIKHSIVLLQIAKVNEVKFAISIFMLIIVFMYRTQHIRLMASIPVQ